MNGGLARPEPVEVRLRVDPAEAPLAYAELPDAHGQVDVVVEVAGPTVMASLVVPADQVRGWAGGLFAAVAVAYREASGDPHALTDTDLAAFPATEGYHPGPGQVVVAAGDDTPARVRFHAAIDIDGRCLATATLRAALIETLTTRFNTSRVAVSPGEPLTGRPLTTGPDPPA